MGLGPCGLRLRLGLGAASRSTQLDAEPYGRWPACATASRSRGCPCSAAGSSRAATCASRSCATRPASPSTIRASPRPRSSGRACCRSTATSTAATAIRSRAAFLKPEVTARFTTRVETPRRAGWSTALAPTGRAEIRRDLAGPLAVNVVAAALGLLDDRAGRGPGLVRRDRRRRRSRLGRRRDRSGGARPRCDALARHVGATIETGGGVLAGATATLDGRTRSCRTPRS